MPRMTCLPVNSFSAGRADSVSSPSAISLAAGDRGHAAVPAFECRFDEIHRRAADEAGDEEIEWPVVELLRRSHLLQLALAHHGDPVAHRHRLDLVVRDVDGGRAEVALELRDLRPHLHTQLRVQVGERLVHQECRRLAHDRAAHRDPLALTAGERARLPLEEALEAQDLRCLLDSLVDLRLRHLLQLQAEGDVVVDGQVRIERIALEDHGDVAIARGHVVDHAIADLEHALGDVLEAGDHPERCRLAAT